MTLKEAQAGEIVIIEDLTDLPVSELQPIRDMGLYETGIVFVDSIKDDSVFFHKDGPVLSIPSEQAAYITVRRYQH